MTHTLITADDDMTPIPITDTTGSSSYSITTPLNNTLLSVNQDQLLSLNFIPRIPTFTTNNLSTATTTSNTNINNSNKPFFRANSLAFSESPYDLFNAQEEFSNPFDEEEDLLLRSQHGNNYDSIRNHKIINNGGITKKNDRSVNKNRPTC